MELTDKQSKVPSNKIQVRFSFLMRYFASSWIAWRSTAGIGSDVKLSNSLETSCELHMLPSSNRPEAPRGLSSLTTAMESSMNAETSSALPIEWK